MKPTRLSTRLGLAVTAMSAVLVLVMAAFAYASISHQLDLRARNGLQEKLEQIEHSLSEGFSSPADVVLAPHHLRDQIVGHDDFTLTILDSGTPRKRLLSLGQDEQMVLPVPFTEGTREDFQRVESSAGHEILIASKHVRLKGGQKVLVLLALDRENDALLLGA
ncbi:MAG: two-component sensor histidine kinase, partial [Pseudomonas caspiana]